MSCSVIAVCKACMYVRLAVCKAYSNNAERLSVYDVEAACCRVFTRRPVNGMDNNEVQGDGPEDSLLIM